MQKDVHAFPATPKLLVEPSDIRALSQKIVAGDESSFEKFFHDYNRRLYAFLLVLSSGDEHLAREIQQIVIRVARKFRVFVRMAPPFGEFPGAWRQALPVQVGNTTQDGSCPSPRGLARACPGSAQRLFNPVRRPGMGNTDTRLRIVISAHRLAVRSLPPPTTGSLRPGPFP